MVTTDRSLIVQGVEIHLAQRNEEDYISLTDMVSQFEGGVALIDSWLRSKNTIEFLGVWERLKNPGFNSVEFDRIRLEAGTNRFRLSVKRWTESVNGTGVVARAGRYGGTFAHKDIAFEFGSWLSPEFKLYLITEFQRFKQAEAEKGIDWNIRRTLAKVQYRVHTDAVKMHLIPPELSSKDASFVYASEADLLNKALFGMTAAEWKSAQPSVKGNIRDDATLEQLIVLSSLESQNALLIQQGLPQAKRLAVLNGQARMQLASLLNNASLPQLRGGLSL